MRKPDAEVREVVCSETGKPMPKIPLWMADVNVKFVSDEARQRHTPSHGVATEPARRGLSDLDDVKDKDVVEEDIEETDVDIEDDVDAEADELDEEEFEE